MNAPDFPPSPAPEPAPPLRVLVVDDEPFARQGVCAYLSDVGFEVQQTGDLAVAEALAGQFRPQVAVLDIAWRAGQRDAAGLRLAQRLKARWPTLGVVLFSAYEDYGQEVWEMVLAGQRGLIYKLKGCRPEALVEAVMQAWRGRVAVDPEVHAGRGLAEQVRARLTREERERVERVLANWETLTDREREAAHWLAASHTPERVAALMGLKAKTIEGYIYRIYQKLDLSEAAEAGRSLRPQVILAKAALIRDLSGDRPR